MAMILGIMLLASFPLVVLAQETDVVTAEVDYACYDLNGDGNVDPLDVGYIQARLGTEDRFDMADLDLDRDHDVDERDVMLMINGLASDVNGDGEVNPLDVGYVLARLGSTNPDDSSADINGNGIVDMWDWRRVNMAISVCAR